MPRAIEIGFDRYLKRSWLDYCFQLMASGSSPENTRALFLDFLAEELPGKDGRRKTFTVMRRIWVSPLESLIPLRDDALTLQPDVVIHWLMAMAAFPFFSTVGEITGRLCSMSDTVSKQPIMRRLYEKYGEREIVERAGRHVLRTFVELGVLTAEGRGHYRRVEKMPVTDRRLWPLIIEAVMRTNQRRIMSAVEIAQNFAFFPFQIENLIHEMADTDRVEYARHGMDKEIYILKAGGGM